MVAVHEQQEMAQALVALAADFSSKEIAPRVAEYDKEERIPRDLLDRMAELGFFGGVIPESMGGLGLDYRTYAMLVEEIAKTCNIMACLVSMPSGLVGASVERYGTQAQIDRYLKPLAGGEIFGAAGVTEPRSGSDVAGMTTTYRRDGDEFVLNGAKAWISNLDIADFFVTFATMDRSLRHRGITAFIVPRDAPGLSLHPYKDKFGFRPICTGELAFDEMRIPADALLGVEGEGFKVAMNAVERGRLGVASRAVGMAQAALDEAKSYAMDREIFGHPVGGFQIVQSKITDMVVGVTTARALTYQAADELQAGKRARQLTSMAKMYAADIAFRSATDAFQIHGAYGVAPEYRIGRILRDAKVIQIVEGSNDLHRALIAEIELGIRPSGEE